MLMYYKDVFFPIKWTTLMKKEMWYSREPSRIIATIKSEDYKSIRMSILNSIRFNNKEKCIIQRPPIENKGKEVIYYLGGLYGYIDCEFSISIATKLFEDKNETTISIEFHCNFEQLEDKEIIRDLNLKLLLSENK